MTGRNVFLAAVSALLTVAGGGAARASTFDVAVEATAGLVGYYPFTRASQGNSVVNGFTGVLENGAAIGGPGSGPRAGDTDSTALVLSNGRDGAAYARPGGATPLLGQIGTRGSIIAWIKLSSLPSDAGRVFSIAGESEAGNDLDLQINGDNTIRFYTDGGSSVASTPLTGADLGQFIFVAATFTAHSDRSIYVNGVLQGTDTPGGHAANGAPFYQGQSGLFGGRYFDGSLAEVALFNTDLTGDQVAALYAAGSAGQLGRVSKPASVALLGVVLLGSGLWARTRR